MRLIELKDAKNFKDLMTCWFNSRKYTMTPVK